MNKRRRFKAKARRRLVRRTMGILLVNERNAKQFLAERMVRRGPAWNSYAAARRMQRMFPKADLHL